MMLTSKTQSVENIAVYDKKIKKDRACFLFDILLRKIQVDAKCKNTSIW